ncbi:HDIG domain-containing metalloprotein [Clostridium sp.]|uniref:HDIG domain-containing metalloprotein n=1 Tax=Clostridium sp. TaxID=1506 RepID=UPI00284857F6|nr:HDIG domain-containing metalloprotein [Clostridium sp.]MDR3594894.1 HDIG domain-containing protein [Clostridium sp.]
MLFYRIKQFYWAIESLFIEDDFEIINKYLNQSELNLFMKLTKSERQHSIRVCNTAIEYIKSNNRLNIDRYIMCKCALLHDIGKSQIKLNIFYKSIIVIINKITCGKFLKYNRNKTIISYYNHAQIGAELLQSINEEDLDIINCVKYHHDDDTRGDNKYLEILRICDNCN